LRNLLETFPEGSALISNVHKEKKWAWPERDVQSLCMAALNIHGTLKGMIIALSPQNETYRTTQQNLLGLVAAQTSITLERASYFRKQEELASCDGLTGLLNHRMFQESIRFEIERAKRYNHHLSLVMFDIDYFKKFNDKYGHPVGDEVLKMVSFTMKGLVRVTDRVFRYGGEEFCILLPETSAENAVNLAERLRKKIEANRAVRGLSVTISLGITGYDLQETPEDFIKRADTMLYKSKENGRNRFTLG
jgi:diguanylate cyclase (GGDEF)-like protein